ncbi:MAG: hypothetical protein II980_05680 [Clostridia bacterium]|nr:hypothetical protein [Clostridia bacterium]
MNNKEKLIIANAVFDANAKAETVKELLDDFIESYIGDKEAQTNLKFELETRPKRIEAKMFTIFQLLCEMCKELEILAM